MFIDGIKNGINICPLSPFRRDFWRDREGEKMQYCQVCKYWSLDKVENKGREENVYELTPTGAIWSGWCKRRNMEIWEYGNCGYFRGKSGQE